MRVDVVRRADFNAFALPGGHIYAFQGLIDRAQTPDEVAGVLAHEIGHVAHRDGTRTVLQAAGLSFLFGMMLGDFVGGGAVVIAAKTVVRSSYSRRVEAQADIYSVGLMRKVGGDPRALAAILARVTADKDEGIKILADHPDTKDRVIAINAIAPAGRHDAAARRRGLGGAQADLRAVAGERERTSRDDGRQAGDDSSRRRNSFGKRQRVRQAGKIRPAPTTAGRQMKAQSDGATPNH